MTLSAAGAAHAVSFGVVGVSSSNTTATVDFSYDGIDTLTIDIMNTASVSPDPIVTGFAFNAPTDVAGISGFTATGTQGNANWFEFLEPDDINTPGNNGQFDIGATTANNAPNNFNSGINGGSTNFGIAANDTGSFTFTLTGDATFLAGLTADSFLSLNSTGGNNAFPFAVRFQQLDDNGVTSDIAFGGPTTVVPVPAALPLFLTALAGLSFASRRRRNAA
ncbi:PEP-CTERM sorting domain-containing protein [Pikeienuella piscinae]|uniref:PEP-CTERM sorting domain-containing protein n=2 Tax=Pikeienuella piscinae TaxID=2748098 RepID=A0A7M3T790_9RHOB|nr:PEP-CTERM sorting domain-containing protein [Pikeienuella piscinae]